MNYRLYSDILSHTYFIADTDIVEEKYVALNIGFFNCSDEEYEKVKKTVDLNLIHLYCSVDVEALYEKEHYTHKEIENLCKKFKYLYDFRAKVLSENPSKYMSLIETTYILDSSLSTRKYNKILTEKDNKISLENSEFIYLEDKNTPLIKLDIKTSRYKSYDEIFETDFGYYVLFFDSKKGTYTVVFESNEQVYTLEPHIPVTSFKDIDFRYNFLVDESIEEVVKNFDFDINEIKALIQNK